MDGERSRPLIYLDHHATTPLDRRVLDAMRPWLEAEFANPASIEHVMGRTAEAAVATARRQVADLINADPREIIFTSGATEANNLAIKGTAMFHVKHRARIGELPGHMVTFATEHKCVLESCRRLEGEGWRVTRLAPGAGGVPDAAAVAAALQPDTRLVSVMAANNEIGVLAPLAEIGRLTRARGILLHCDAAQAFGKVALDVQAQNIDLMSLSGHKMYGPKGIGVLYVRRRPRVRLEPLFDGGGQEQGLRAGTLAAPLIIGLGEAARLAGLEMAQDAARLDRLAQRLHQRLAQEAGGISLNGAGQPRLPGSLNLRVAGVAAQDLLAAVPELCLSTGSACASGAPEPSYVLTALGLDRQAAMESFRLAIGRFTSDDQVARAGDLLTAAIGRLRRATPPAAASGQASAAPASTSGKASGTAT
ncbi:MAG: aminotransferase class V-fold PLP-dependent enzyme [Alphaproteobacteria bacterium]